MAEFKNVSWSGNSSIMDITKLQQMSANDQALSELIPRMLYNNRGVTKETGIKFLFGETTVAPSNKWSQWNTHKFESFFTGGCSPIVIANAFGAPQYGISFTTTGPSKTQFPTERGFGTYLWANDYSGTRSRINNPITFKYIAIGY